VPGLRDYAILAAVQSVFPELGIKRENFVVVSGIGCSSRFPYYMNTFGFHTIHAARRRLPRESRQSGRTWKYGWRQATATRFRLAAITRFTCCGAMSDSKSCSSTIVFYGLTKGQYSPTSEVNKKTKSTPFGSVDRPFKSRVSGIGAEATFVRRLGGRFSVSPERHAEARGGAQGFGVRGNPAELQYFNDGAWVLNHGTRCEERARLATRAWEAASFGKNRDKGIRRKSDVDIEVVALGRRHHRVGFIVHDAHHPRPSYAFLLSTWSIVPAPDTYRRVPPGTICRATKT